MSPSWISTQHIDLVKQGDGSQTPPKSFLSQRTKRFWISICVLLLIITIGLGVGLGVGLTRGNGSGGSASSEPSPPLGNNTNTTAGTYWKPVAGTPWQIVLQYALNDTSVDVPVYDIDLFTNPKSTIDNLHSMNRSVICYFSAGSYEDFRPDSSNFTKDDYAKPLKGWPGEYWLNTNSSNVRSIMSSRLALAASKGCDGVDPDNVDGYDNDSGIDLTTDTAINYLTFLTIEAHALNMSIGLKNAGAIVNATVEMLQWEVNEQCGQYGECEDFRPFIDAGKPVFRIEYPNSTPKVSTATVQSICNNTEAEGFSTVIKNMSLDDWVDSC
jgi:endo-alpha-1,4-polygalactosaminidase (GH114 family)